jgi:hypothetical protein
MIKSMIFSLPDGETVEANIRRLVGAGYAGRNQEDVLAHVEQLRTAGVAPPPHVPMLFPFIPTLASQETVTFVLGGDTTPEVEFVIFRQDGLDYVTVGSDQTDNAIEKQSMCLAKNCCVKTVASGAWRVSEVSEHWDQLRLKLSCNGTVMQSGNLGELLTHEDLLRFVEEQDGAQHEGRMVFSGTLPTHGTFPKGEVTLEISLSDPRLNRSIRHSYTVIPMQPFF